jgi:DNA helicase II / ATP-dependent DNA helicase PcrA
VADLLDGLNERQHEAVTLPDVSAIILAGAGSGKTKVLTTRIAWLIGKRRAQEHSVLAVTFTNKAAREMRLRIERMTGISTGDMWIGTFHGLCNRILRENFGAAGLPKGFAILDEGDQERMLKRILSEHGAEKQIPAGEMKHYISSRKEKGVRPGKSPALTDDEKLCEEIYASYELRCAKEGAVDFAELMLRCIDLLENNAALRNRYAAKFTHILVDEFQDTNPLQYRWLKLLRAEATSIFAVGDDDQSIYGFRNADPRNMQDFVQNVAGDRVIRLEQNYRSHGNILLAANSLIEKNQRRLGKNLWTQAEPGGRMQVMEFENDLDEADQVARTIKQLLLSGLPPSEIAILYRSNAQSRGYEKALIGQGVPYAIYGGTRFFERMEIKNAIAYMRLVMNYNDDTSFSRIVNIPSRGIGEVTVNEIRDIATAEGVSMLEAAATRYQGARERIDGFVNMLATLVDSASSMPLPKFIEHVLTTTGLSHFYDSKKSEEDKARVANLQELVSAAAAFCRESPCKDAARIPAIEILDEFVATATLQASSDVGHSDKKAAIYNPNCVTLMTVHAAKGLEFDTVIVAGLDDGIFPHSMSLEEGNIEEERRLMYVAITRAKRNLIGTHAKRRMVFGRMEDYGPSRFLEEMPKELLDTKKFPSRHPRSDDRYRQRKPASSQGAVVS